jgi:FKBP-type peptidyl-prolyl cis-trans isomerase FkpA
MKRIHKTGILSGLFTIALALFVTTANAQSHVKKPAPAESTGKATKMANGFTRLPSGLQYKIIKHGTGTRKPMISDHIELNIHLHVGDSVIFDSRKMNNNKPVPLPIAGPKFKGDPVEGFMLMVEGDSAVMRLPVDSLKKAGAQLQPWMKEGQVIEYDVKLVSVRTEAEDKKIKEEEEAKQRTIDENLLQDYFKKNNIKPMKTASGLYYTIAADGAGANAKSGQKLSVNYTGTLLNGKKFDSNTDSAFHHVSPFELEIGKGHVIKGWDEGLLLLKKGSKATLYIPSTLAYGSQDRSPQIPANSILIFDIEILDMQDAPPPPIKRDPSEQARVDDKLIQDYLDKNNIKATKTPTGLYYVITRKGLGPNAKQGSKVSMNYTGKTLDGNAFDSNMDPQFKHVQPFGFTLGVGQVIKGWDEGVQLLNLGSKATFFIPSALAYGERGAGGHIPPNAVLMFDVEVLSVDK